MVRNFREFLARGKSPPGKNSPRFGDHTEPATTDGFEATTIKFDSDPCDEQRLFGAWIGPENPPGRYVCVYEDEDGDIQCKGSEELQTKLIQTGHGKFREAFQELFDVPDYSPEDMSLSSEENEVREEVDYRANDELEGHQTVRVSREDVLREWYRHIFERIQSLQCKVMVKAWIAKIQPKKSRFYPYNGGAEATAQGLERNDTRRHELAVPPWWPGGRRPVSVPHREPDHLDKHQLVELCLHILTGMWGMKVGIDNEPLCVDFLRAATKEVEPRIQRMKNGKRSWDLLDKLYNVREFEERFLNGGSGGRTTVSLQWYRPSGRTNSDARSKRPRKQRKLSHAPNGAFSSVRSKDDNESDTSPSERSEQYEGNSPAPFALMIPQDNQETSPKTWTSLLVDSPKASLPRADANQTSSRRSTKRFLQGAGSSHALSSEPLGSFTPIDNSRAPLYSSWDARDRPTMSRGWHSNEQGILKRDPMCTWLPSPLGMNNSASGVSSTVTAPYQWRNASATYPNETFPPCETSDYHMAFSDQQAFDSHMCSRGQQFTFPSGLPHPFLGQEPRES